MAKYDHEKVGSTPSDELWLQLTREQDARGIPVPVREFPESDKRQIWETQNLERLRGRFSLPIKKPGESRPRLSGTNQCVRCLKPLPKHPEAAGAQLVRRVYARGEKFNFYRCGSCG